MLYNTGAFTGTVHVTTGDWISVDLVHTDLRLDFENGAWNHEVGADIPFGSPNVGGAANPTNLDFDEALLRVNAASVVTLSTSLDPVLFSFLGKAPGEQLWALPQSQKAGVLWPGFNTEGIAGGTLAAYTPSGDSRVTANASWVRLELVAARMPSGAVFSLYQSGAGGVPLVWWDTKDGINSPGDASEGGNVTDVMWINTGTHAHMNWTFTHAGRYELDVRSRAFINDGGNLVEVVSGINTLHLLVLDSNTGPLVESVPTAVNDTLTLNEDAGAAVVNVLANDRSEPDLLKMPARDVRELRHDRGGGEQENGRKKFHVRVRDFRGWRRRSPGRIEAADLRRAGGMAWRMPRNRCRGQERRERPRRSPR